MRLISLVGIATAFFTFIASAKAALDDGLISYWPFETANIDNTPDVISGNHLFLHNLGKTNLAEGRYNQAMFLDGKRQFMSLNYAQHRKLPLSVKKNFTIAMWVKGAAGQTNRIVFAEGYTTDRIPLFLLGTPHKIDNPSVNVLVRGRVETPIENIPAEAIVFDDAWHHLAWVDENGSVQLYIDGKQDVTSYHYERKETRLNCLSVGALLRTPATHFFKGAVDDLAIWERALNRDEIQNVMNGGLTRFTTEKQARNE